MEKDVRLSGNLLQSQRSGFDGLSIVVLVTVRYKHSSRAEPLSDAFSRMRSLTIGGWWDRNRLNKLLLTTMMVDINIHTLILLFHNCCSG